MRLGKEDIQNRTNWCWAAACKVVGRQYKEINLKYGFALSDADIDYINSENQMFAVTSEEEGIRPEVVCKKNGVFLVDAWQRAIVKNANTVLPGMEGNISGDDDAKIRGLKYVLTGDCDSRAVEIESAGLFNMQESLLDIYEAKIREA